MVHHIESPEEFGSILSKAGNKLVVIEFGAEWCGPCRMIGPHFEKMAKEDQFKNAVQFYAIDVDELSELAEEVGIPCLPTFLFFRKGQKIDEMSGANTEMLKSMLAKYK